MYVTYDDTKGVFPYILQNMEEKEMNFVAIQKQPTDKGPKVISLEGAKIHRVQNDV